MENKKKLKVTFAGKSYSIFTDEQEGVVTRAAELVDDLLKGYSEKMPTSDPYQKALLVAFQLATDVTKNSDELHRCKSKTEELSDLISKHLQTG